MNRICPEANTLSEYLADILDKDKREKIEKHLCSCQKCRELVKDAYLVTSKKSITKILLHMASFCLRHFCLFLSVFLLAISFLLRPYFIQFIAASLISATIWSKKITSVNNVISISSKAPSSVLKR